MAEQVRSRRGTDTGRAGRRVRAVLAPLALALVAGGCTGGGSGATSPTDPVTGAATASPPAGASASPSPGASAAPVTASALAERVNGVLAEQTDLPGALREGVPQLPTGDLGVDAGKVTGFEAKWHDSVKGRAELSVRVVAVHGGTTYPEILQRLRAATFEGEKTLKLVSEKKLPGLDKKDKRSELRFEPPERTEFLQVRVDTVRIDVFHLVITDDPARIARFRADYGGWLPDVVDLGEPDQIDARAGADLTPVQGLVLAASFPREPSGRGRAAAKAATKAVRRELEAQGRKVTRYEFPLKTPFGATADAGRIELEADDPFATVTVVPAWVKSTKSILVAVSASVPLA